MTECGIWPPDRVFDVPAEELKLVGLAIARKKGKEHKFLAAIHGAKTEEKAEQAQTEPKGLKNQFTALERKGFPIEDYKDGKRVN